MFKCELFKARKEHNISCLCTLLPFYLPFDNEDHCNEGHHVYHCTDEEVQVAVPVQTGHVQQQGVVRHRNSKPTYTQNTKRVCYQESVSKSKPTQRIQEEICYQVSNSKPTHTHKLWREMCYQVPVSKSKPTQRIQEEMCYQISNNKPTHTHKIQKEMCYQVSNHKPTHTQNTKRIVLSSKQQQTYTHTKYKEKYVIK